MFHSTIYMTLSELSDWNVMWYVKCTPREVYHVTINVKVDDVVKWHRVQHKVLGEVVETKGKAENEMTIIETNVRMKCMNLRYKFVRTSHASHSFLVTLALNGCGFENLNILSQFVHFFEIQESTA